MHHSSAVAFARALYSGPYVKDLTARLGQGTASSLLKGVPRELRITVRIYRGRPPLKVVHSCVGSID